MSQKEEVKTLSHGKPKRAKRGVGTIIGAAFIVMILLSGFAFYSLILNNIDSYTQSASEANASELNRNQEQLTISSIQITSENKLNLTVKNTGSVSSKLLWLGLFNQSVTPEWQQFFPLSEQIEPGGTTNITSNFTITQNQKYLVQITTEAGNSFSSTFYPASKVNCALSLTVASPTTYAGNNVTVMLTITPNDPEVDIVQNITASISAAPVNLVQLVGNSPLTVTGLARGNSAFFWWVYKTISTGTVTFNATYSSAPAGSYALTNVTILPTPGQGGSGSVSITGVTGTARYNPSQWNLLNSTQSVSGSVADLKGNDSSYAVFGSYVSAYSGSATFGPNATGTSEQDINTKLAGATATCPTLGKAVSITARIHNNDASHNRDVVAAIYQGSTLMGTSNSVVVPFGTTAWYNFTFASPVDLSASTSYNIVMDANGGGPRLLYTDGTGTGVYVDSSYPPPSSVTFTTQTRSYDIYCTYTPASQYTCGVVFTGSSNLQNWTSLLWETESCWNAPQVTVTVQFYNFALDNYASTGSGYSTYISSATANITELQSQTENSSPNNFRNSTGYWQVKIIGVKSTNTPFLMKIDLIDIQTKYSTSSNTIPYNTWQFYSINATTTTGNPIPYAYVAIYSNGTNITFQNAIDGTNMTNPIWVYLGVSGTYLLNVNSASATSQTFMLYAVVGSVVGQKTVTQSAP